MSKEKKVNKDRFLGYVVTFIALIFIIIFPFFAHYENKVQIHHNINQELKKEGTRLTSVTFDRKVYDYQSTKESFLLKEKHNSLYKAFYHMLDFKTGFGNDRVYEVKDLNNEKYEFHINRKFQVVQWHKL